MICDDRAAAWSKVRRTVRYKQFIQMFRAASIASNHQRCTSDIVDTYAHRKRERALARVRSHMTCSEPNHHNIDRRHIDRRRRRRHRHRRRHRWIFTTNTHASLFYARVIGIADDVWWWCTQRHAIRHSNILYMCICQEHTAQMQTPLICCVAGQRINRSLVN